ncbi:glycosyltransferase family 2 protein [Chelativorans salis]|uniref:Glycosyltransferase family 2 protein n=1 Tax=Chelativorans salis TaxID=2978478 RepID=A0ABT2LLX3_9HYPH|nr:glycosyltransferase [Chelativorans sp. EGI FJ00035]MCT7375581.1 glycosyltransferase family 2 protein [Chelativorans sp. EGI FJ00035]
MAQASGTRFAIGIATSGRREILKTLLPHLARQVRRPDEVVICAAREDDVDMEALDAIGLDIRVLVSERGLCRQRNHILRNVPAADILLFLDDDFLMAPSYVDETERIFVSEPSVIMCTGTVDADGITGPGIDISEALAIIDRGRHDPADASDDPQTIYNAYGCNMAVRMATVRTEGLAFDENLPLYGWLEDVDFSRQMARHGKIVISRRLRGVHLGTKSGRTSGVRFGYSQIANPIYLVRKKTMSLRHASVQIARNLLANTIKLFTPEPWVDRKGRFKGNIRALADLLRGRLAPQNVAALE